MKQLLLLSALFAFISCTEKDPILNVPTKDNNDDRIVPTKDNNDDRIVPLKGSYTNIAKSYFNFNDTIFFQNKEVNYYWSDDNSYAVAECGNLLLFVNRQNEFVKIYRDRSKEAGKDEGEWWIENNQIKLSPPKPNRYVFPDVHVNSNQIGGNTNLERPDKNNTKP